MLKFLAEFSPLIAFFIGYKIKGIFEATLYMLIASVISISVMYLWERKINKITLFSTLFLCVSSGLTLLSGNSMFIKIKPTVFYSTLAIAFCYTNFKYQPLIQKAIGSIILLKDETKWKILNLRFMWFFLCMAILNEVIWRNCSEEHWVSFKVFGTMPIILIFSLIQIPFFMKYKKDD